MSIEKSLTLREYGGNGLAKLTLGIIASFLVIWLLNLGWFFVLLLLVAVILFLLGLDSYRSWLLLLFAASFSGYRFDFASFTIRPDHVLLIVLIFGWFLNLMAGKARIYRIPLLLPIALYAGLNFLSSVFFAPDKAASYQGASLLVLYMTMYVFTFLVLRQRPEKVKSAIAALMIAGVIQAVFALIAVGGHYAGMDLGGVSLRHIESAVSLQGGFEEPNLLGAFVAAVGLMFLAFLTTRQDQYKVSNLSIGLSLVLVVLALTFTRAAWVGFILGLVLLLFLQKPQRNIFNPRAAAIILSLILVFTVAMLPLANKLAAGLTGQANFVVERATKILDFSGGSAEGRVQVQELAIEKWQNAKILGNGTLSFPKEEADPSPAGSWLYSSVIQALHDTGILGLLALVWIQLGALWIIAKGYRQTSNSFYRTALAGFAAGSIALIVASQASSFIWLGFPWIFNGMAVALATLASETGNE